MAHGQGPTKVHHIIKENYTLAHTEKCLEYLDTVETIARKQAEEEEKSRLPGHQPSLRNTFIIPQPFPGLKLVPNFNSEEYAGKYPSGKTKSTFYFTF